MTKTEYTAFHAVRKVTAPGDGVNIPELITVTQYDKGQRAAVVSDNAGNKKEYRYDSMGHKTEETMVNAFTGEKITLTYAYDTAGRLTESTDAMGTQTSIVKKIRRKQADYVLALKGNQGGLYEDVKL